MIVYGDGALDSNGTFLQKKLTNLVLECSNAAKEG